MIRGQPLDHRTSRPNDALTVRSTDASMTMRRVGRASCVVIPTTAMIPVAERAITPAAPLTNAGSHSVAKRGPCDATWVATSCAPVRSRGASQLAGRHRPGRQPRSQAPRSTHRNRRRLRKPVPRDHRQQPRLRTNRCCLGRRLASHRHVRRAVRGDRAHCGQVTSRRPTISQPGATAGAWGDRGRRSRSGNQRQLVDAFLAASRAVTRRGRPR
jgi:hypothetical protein